MQATYSKPAKPTAKLLERCSRVPAIIAALDSTNDTGNYRMIGLYHYIALGLFAGFALLELVARAAATFRRSPTGGFRARPSPLLYFALATYAPLFWDGWLGEHRLFAADTPAALGRRSPAASSLLELGIYAWHRTMHNVTVPVALVPPDAPQRRARGHLGGALFPPVRQHRLDLRRQPGAGAWFRSQRRGGDRYQPDRHLLRPVPACERPDAALARLFHPAAGEPFGHHERGVHARNYSDLPFWDIVFGTFHNPKEFAGEVGFYEGGSKKLGPLLAGRLIA